MRKGFASEEEREIKKLIKTGLRKLLHNKSFKRKQDER